MAIEALVGIIQSLLLTCRLHEVDAYTHLVDVLQRISVHPANRAIELTPRMWTSLFADDPPRSDLGLHCHDPHMSDHVAVRHRR